MSDAPALGVLFDVAGLEHKPGRYGRPVLRCPTCARWCPELVIDGRGAFSCWRCWRAARTTPRA